MDCETTLSIFLIMPTVPAFALSFSDVVCREGLKVYACQIQLTDASKTYTSASAVPICILAAC